MKHSHEFSNGFSRWQIGWKPIIFLNIHRPPNVFRKYRERERERELYLRNDSPEENIIDIVSGLIWANSVYFAGNR